MANDILNELDLALEELRAARGRLTELLPPPGNTGEDVGVGAWEQAQKALINAQEKVEMARREIKRLLAE
jgi:hypothetical protein